MKPNIEAWQRDAWKVHPKLNVPGKFPSAVMFALFDSDPREKFSDIWKQSADAEISLRENLHPPMTSALLHESLLFAAWDQVFHRTPGDRVALLFNRSRDNSMASSSQSESTIEIMVSSNEAADSKWLVTRASWYDGKAVCWCIPINVQQGQTTDVDLTVQNMVTIGAN
jgi:hypothetical protein